METIQLFEGRPDYDWQQLLAAAFALGTLSGTDTQMVLTYGDITVTFTGTDLSVSDTRTFDGGWITSISLSQGATLIALADNYADPIEFTRAQNALDVFAGTPTENEALNAIGDLFYSEPTILTGSDADDTLITSGVFHTTVNAGDGNDILMGRDAADADLNGEDGDDVIIAGNGNNVEHGGAGNDTITGGNGGDWMIGGAGNDQFDGGDGWNNIVYVEEQNGAGLGINFNWVTGVATDSFGDADTFANIDSVHGTNSADTFIGNADENTFHGYGGNDVIDGGDGRDTVHYHGEQSYGGANGVTIVLDDGTGVGEVHGHAIDGYGDTDDLTSIENAEGTEFADSITGSGEENNLRGLGGSDTINGAGASDFINPGAGDDIVDGGAGDYDNLEYHDAEDGIVVSKTDRLSGTVTGTWAGTDTFTNIEIAVGSNHADTFNGSAEDDDFTGNAGADAFNGGGGSDTVVYEKEQYAPGGENSQGVIVNLSNSVISANIGQGSQLLAGSTAVDGFGDIDTLDSIERIVATDVGDHLQGGDGHEVLVGNGGNDTILGGAGNDRLAGGEGNDSLEGGSDADVFEASLGVDTVGDFNVAEDTIDLRFFGIKTLGELQSLIVAGNTTDAIIQFSPGDSLTLAGVNWNSLTVANFIFGTFGAAYVGDGLANVYDGTDADEQIFGNGGDDTLNGNGGDDEIYGGADNDLISGGNGNDRLFGESGADILDGGDNGDRLAGGAGNDTLVGGASSDFQQDTADYYSEQNGGGGPVSVNLATGIAVDTYGDTDTLSGIEEVTGTDGDDTMISGAAGSGYNGFRGFAGNDTFVEGGNRVWVYYGNDAELGGTEGIIVNLSDDNLVGIGSEAGFAPTDIGAGQAKDGFGDIDTLDGILNIRGSGQADWIMGSDQADHFQMQQGNDYIDGGEGDDIVDYAHDIDEGAPNRGAIVNLSDTDLVGVSAEGVGPTDVAVHRALDGFGDTDTLVDIERVVGTNFGDLIVGNDQDNNINGRAGSDVLFGGAGNDYFEGSRGNDTVDGGGGRDKVGFGGNDAGDNIFVTLSGEGDGTITGQFEGYGISQSFADLERIAGTAGQDSFVAAPGASATADSEDFWLSDQDDQTNDQHRGFNVIGGDGSDTFTDNSGAHGGVLIVDYQDEKWSHEDYNGGTFGNGVDQFGVAVNMTAGDVVVGGDTIASGTATDTFGSTDAIEGVRAFRLSDASDTFYAGSGGYSVQGQDGDDTIVGGDGDDNLDGNQGDDTVTGGDGNDWLGGWVGNDTLAGEAGDDSFEGNDGNDVIQGGDGFDWMRGGKGNDTLDGGNDSDTVQYREERDENDQQGTLGVVVNLSNDALVTGVDGAPIDLAAHSARDSFGDLDNLISIEHIEGTDEADYVVGGDEDNEFDGRSGDDTLIGGSGHNRLQGGDGNDTLIGGADNDDLDAGRGDDTVIAGGGNFDYINGSSGADNISGGDGYDLLAFKKFNGADHVHVVLDTSGAGNGTITGAFDGEAVSTTFTGVEQVTGTAGDDTFVVSTGFEATGDSRNTFWDGRGSNGRGFDFVGGNGNDTFTDNSGIEGGASLVDYDEEKFSTDHYDDGWHQWGTEAGEHGVIVNLSSAAQTVTGFDLNDGNAPVDVTVQSGQAFDTFGGTDTLNGIQAVVLTDADDHFFGDDDGVYVEGRMGDDTIAGGGARDLLSGGDGDDNLVGGDGDDSLSGWFGDDVLLGGDGGDYINAGFGNDTADGGTGNWDTLGFSWGQVVNPGDGIAVVFDTTGVPGGGTVTGSYGDGTDDQGNPFTGSVNLTFSEFEHIEGTSGDDSFTLQAGFVPTAASPRIWPDGRGNGLVDVSAGAGADSFADLADTSSDGVSGGSMIVSYDGDKWGVGNYDGHVWGSEAGEHGVAVNLSNAQQTATGFDLNDGSPVFDLEVAAHTGFDLYGDIDSLTGVQSVWLTDADDWFWADDNRDSFVGGAAGDDHLFGGSGDDVFEAGDGDDIIVGGNGANTARAGAGNDTITGGEGDDWMIGGAGNDQFNGGDGWNNIDYTQEQDGGGSGITFDWVNGTSTDSFGDTDTFANIDSVHGTNSADTFIGNADENTFHGYGGNDIIIGGDGRDTVHYHGEQFHGGTNGVTIVLDDGTGVGEVHGYAIDGYGDTDDLSSIEDAEGTIFNDTITGSAEANFLGGLDGDDTLIGGGGNDTLQGGAGDDLFVYASGEVTITDFIAGGTDDAIDLTAVAGVVSLAQLLTHVDQNNHSDTVITFGAGQSLTLGGVDWEDLTEDDFVFDTSDAYDVTVPVDTDSATNAVDENASIGTVVGITALATDDDATNNTVTYSLSSNPGGLFAVDAQTGVVTTAAAIDREAVGPTVDIEVTASSSDGSTAAQVFTIAVGDVNEAPVITSGSGGDTFATSVAENTTATTTVVATDVDVAAVMTYAIVGGADQDLFTIDEQTGAVTFVSAPDFETPLDADGDNVYEVVVAASDGSLSDSQALSVTVTDTNGVTINGTSGGDTIDATHTVAGQPLPTNEDDTIFGNGGNDTIFALGGNDLINGGAGADTMHGGTGNDTYVVDNAGDAVVEAEGEGADLVQSSITHALAANVEDLTLTGTGNINGTGNVLANLIAGNAGNNVLNGAVGADTLSGGAGNDTYVVDDAGDTVTEAVNEGTDLVQSSVTYVLGSEVEKLTLTGTADIDGTGNEAGNTITGNAGNNVLDGGGGADILVGGLGNDTYIIDGTADTVTEASNAGTDTLLFNGAGDYTLSANVENLVLGVDAVNGTGNTLANTITGNSQANVLSGAAGADTLIGGAGDDTYAVDNASDAVVEAADEGTDLVQSSVTHTLASDVENLTLTGTAAISGIGNALANIITGNTGANTLNGGAGADTLIGGAGNDTYVVDDAEDVVDEASNAGAGTDTIQASLSFSLADESHVLGDVERLTLTGSANIDGTGTAGNNIITGNTGNNVLNGGGGTDTLAGGLGDDTYVTDGGDTITEALDAGTDTVESSVNYTLGANLESLVLTDAALTGTGNAAANTITGNALNNTLSGGAGDDTLIGGEGDDTYIVDSTNDVVVEAADEGTDLVRASATYTLGANVEDLTLTGTSAIDGTGNGLANAILGNSAANILDGGVGNDQLNGGTGADTLIGGLGDDTFVVDNIGDSAVEAEDEGLDLVQSSVSFALGDDIENLTLTGTGNASGTGNALANAITGNAGNNTLNGGLGADTMVGGAGNDIYVVDDAGDVIDELANAGTGTDTVQSSISFSLADAAHVLGEVERLTLTGVANINGTGNAANNIITGNSGSNILDGGAGVDALVGGLGNDTYVVDSVSDVTTEAASAGTDTVQFVGTAGTFVLGANVENLTLMGASAIDGTGNTLSNVLLGNSATNTLSGGAGADTLNGGAGADILIGGSGNDTYVVDNADDAVDETTSGGAGIDTVQSSVAFSLLADGVHVTGSVENLTLTGFGNISGTGNALDNVMNGNKGDNFLFGNAGADTVSGGAGNDTIIGGTGHDALFGGSGADTFDFNVADFGGAGGVAADHSDDIFDFSGLGAENDIIDVSGLFDDAFNLLGGDVDQLVRAVFSGDDVTIEMNENAVLDGSAINTDWSAAFTIHDVEDPESVALIFNNQTWHLDANTGLFGL